MKSLEMTPRFTKVIAVCGAAALMLSVAPIGPDGFLISTAHAQQGGNSDSGNAGGGNSDSGGSGGGGSDSGNAGSGGSGNNNAGAGSGNAEAPKEPAGQSGTQAPNENNAGSGSGSANTAGGSGTQSTGESGGAAPAAGGQQAESAGGEPRGQGGEKTLSEVFLSLTGEDDDSDRPDWAGEPGGKDGAGGGQPDGSGTTKGDLFGDLWVIARDADGIPILTDEGWVQPLDADGNLIALDEEGHPIDESLTIEVELGRLNVGRAPVQVLEKRADEVIALMEAATEVTTDAAGRLVFTVDGVERTIDSPLENLAIYTSLVTTGTIPGVTDLPGTEFDFMVDGKFTAEDLVASASFLAAATDKTGVFSADEIAYINAFLDVNTVTVGSVTYSEIDYSDFTYSRAATYDGLSIEVLVEQEDGSWVPTVIDVYDVVFGGEAADDGGSLAAYTLAADDARTIVNFMHEYEIPASDLSQVTH
ncbi:hypothetical protein [Actibacterium lipolyticum]|uniref:Uncharacterized protein n=1 Tax=Actibacterium lipolyticum TaxID=1524263 RepID=A0A238KRP4_9RHOB|nr:hypothetical protein [Actibacterium lipolyticum]SMX44792.1 hypothetical protein COL8621_02634 [Actibacterium lipolyticum]